MSRIIDRESLEVLAGLLDTVDFPTVINIVNGFVDGKYNILPYLTNIKSSESNIDIYDLTKCCRVRTLTLPNCNNLADNILMMLPYLESLTISNNTELTSDVFRHLNYLTKLQIVGPCDKLLDVEAFRSLSRLEMLYICNSTVKNEYFHHLCNLKVLILDDNPLVTPAILNYLPKIEICIINKILYKYISSTKNNAILKKIGKINRVKIYAVENY